MKLSLHIFILSFSIALFAEDVSLTEKHQEIIDAVRPMMTSYKPVYYSHIETTTVKSQFASSGNRVFFSKKTFRGQTNEEYYKTEDARYYAVTAFEKDTEEYEAAIENLQTEEELIKALAGLSYLKKGFDSTQEAVEKRMEELVKGFINEELSIETLQRKLIKVRTFR